MPDLKQTQDVPLVAGPETPAPIHAPASTTIPQHSSSETLPLPTPNLICPPSLLAPSQHAVMKQAKPRRKGGPGPFRRRRMDHLILEYCAHGPTALSGLTGEIFRSTLYRRVTKLVQAGSLRRCGLGYETTTVGQCWLAEAQAHIDWNVFDRLYPPFADIPTPYHKALLELILSAAVVRKAGYHEDHLCAFAAMGGTLKWKTSCGRMACAMLGADPNVSLIDLSSEAGRSVFVRRTSHGHLLSQRNVLSNPLVVFDDVLQANDALRDAIRPFLSGRRMIPYENGVIAVDCVTLLTLNPRVKPTLEQQTALNPAQLRRLIVCNFDFVAMPNLSLTGHLALEAALTHGPLPLPALRTDLQPHRPAVVQLIREVVRPERLDRIDSEMLLQLAAGMCGFIDDAERAVQQTLYDFGLMIHTLGWARPDWVTAVSHFSLHRLRPSPIESSHTQPKSTPNTEAVHDVILIRRRIMNQPESDRSPYTLSEEARARFILMAAEEQISFAQAVDVITDFYESDTKKSFGMDLHDLHSILALSRDLKVRELSVKHLKVTLELLDYLHKHQLEFEAFEPAVHLLQRLQQFGLTADAPDVTRILDVACELITSGVSPLQVEQWLAQRATETGR